MKTQALLVALLVGLAGPAFAQGDPASDLDKALARMSDATGDDYVAARTQAASSKAALEARLAAATWTDKSFRDLSLATIALAYATSPETVARVNHLEGVDPDHYLKRRRPDPECGRELKALGKVAAGPVLELYLKTFASYPFTDPAKAKDALRKRGDLEALAAKERAALREAIVIALSEWRHPAAFFVCKAVARDASEAEGTRLQAIEGLGTLGTAEALAEIEAIHADATQPAVRYAALRGASRVPLEAALTFLAKRLDAGDGSERKAAAAALGMFGSPWGWEARGADLARTTGDALRSRTALLLVDALARDAADATAIDVIVEALAIVAHAKATEPLAKLEADETKPEATRAAAKRARERLAIALERHRR